MVCWLGFHEVSYVCSVCCGLSFGSGKSRSSVLLSVMTPMIYMSNLNETRGCTLFGLVMCSVWIWPAIQIPVGVLMCKVSLWEWNLCLHVSVRWSECFHWVILFWTPLFLHSRSWRGSPVTYVILTPWEILCLLKSGTPIVGHYLVLEWAHWVRGFFPRHSLRAALSYALRDTLKESWCVGYG